MRLADIASPDAGGQAINGIVGARRQLLGIVERNRGHDRPKDFFLHDLHVFFRVHQNRGLHEVAFAVEFAATGRGASALAESDLKVVADALQLLFGDQRTHLRVRLHTGPYFDVSSMFGDAVHYLIESRTLYIEPRTGAAALSVVEENRARRTGNG